MLKIINNNLLYNYKNIYNNMFKRFLNSCLVIITLLTFGSTHSNAQFTNQRCFDETGTIQLYDPSCCCTSGWCGPLNEKFITEVPGGWKLTIPPDGHVKLQPGTYFVPQELAKPSPDGRWHACGFSTVNCFLRVPGGV